jgi:hypothetical protein
MTDREKLLVAMVGEDEVPQPRYRLTVFEVAAMLAAQRRMPVGAGSRH